MRKFILSACILGASLAGAPGRLLAVDSLPSRGFALENGDVNGDLARDVSDGVYALSNLFLGGPPPAPLAYCGWEPSRLQNGDMNDDGTIDISDPVRLFSWLFAGGSAPAAACEEGQGGAANTNPRVIPPNAKAFGKSYGEWAAGFTQWALSMPVDVNPVVEGTDISAGQSGQVWFLGGTFAATLAGGAWYGIADRSGEVPAGKALYFPIMNAECSGIEGNGTTDAELRSCAEYWTSHITEADCEIDGTALSDLEHYNIESPLSSFGPLPENNLIAYLYGADWNAENGGTVGVVTPSVTMGYHVMLAPLPVGPHTIHFGGTLSIPEIDYLFYLDVTYHLTVVPAR